MILYASCWNAKSLWLPKSSLPLKEIICIILIYLYTVYQKICMKYIFILSRIHFYNNFNASYNTHNIINV